LEVQEHGVMSETSMELTSGNEPLQPVEEVIVATKAQTQTGERNLEVADSQPQTDENPPSLAAPAPFLNSSYSNSESYDTEEEIQEEVIVPSRAVPQTGERAFFSERIFSESGDNNDVEGSIVAEAASVVESRRPRGPAVDVTQIDKKQEDAMRAAFRKVSGTDMEIDAYELQDILNAAFMKGSEFKFEGFTPDTCRSLVAMMDLDQSGKLGFEEFKKLWTDLRIWKAAFKDHDKDKSGNFNSYELRSAFHSIGLRVSNMTFNSLVLRYSRRDGKIYFDDYIHCVARLKTMFDVYKAAQKGRKAEFGLDEFIQTTMYS
jgi:calpain